MAEFSYSASIHALVSSMAIMNLDDDVKDVLDTIFGLNLRLEPNYEAFEYFHADSVMWGMTEPYFEAAPPIDILEDVDDPEIYSIRMNRLRLFEFAKHPQLVAHYSPLGSPDYILDFKSVEGRKESYVALEVWSASYQWFGITQYGLTKGRLIARMAITPTSAPSTITGPKPWTFNKLDSATFEYVVTEAIHASQQFKVCDTCDHLVNKLSFSKSRTCDFCAGIIH